VIDLFTLTDVLRKARDEGRLIFVMGNGAGASLSAHFVSDLMKAGCRAFDLTSNSAALTAYANDFGYEHVFEEQLKSLAREGDVVIGISASGQSSNVLNAIAWARYSNMMTVGFTGFGGGELRNIVKHSVNVDDVDMQRIENVFAVLMHEVVWRLK